MSMYVVFIGGYLSSQHDMHVWKASASKQVRCLSLPRACKLVGCGCSPGFEKQLAAVVSDVESASANAFFIVGYSSGCAIANALNARASGDHSRITLFNLDGFRARHDQIHGSKVKAWCAHGPGPKDKSIYWAEDKEEYHFSSAKTPSALHLSSVNKAATNTIGGDNLWKTGYPGCVANLCWLPSRT